MKDYTSYYMPSNKEMKAEHYFDNDLCRPEMYDIAYEALTIYGSPITKQCKIYKDKITNFRTPTLRLLAFYAYGINNIEQFGGSLDIAIFQAIHRTAYILYGVTKNYVEDEKQVRLHNKQLEKLINPVYNSLNHIAVRNAAVINSRLRLV